VHWAESVHTRSLLVFVVTALFDVPGGRNGLRCLSGDWGASDVTIERA
jgi:hypothetical protein